MRHPKLGPSPPHNQSRHLSIPKVTYLLITHDLDALDRAIRPKLRLQLLLINIIVQVLDIQVNSLPLLELFLLLLLELLLQLILTLSLLLCALDVQFPARNLLVMQVVDRRLCRVMRLKVNKGKALILARVLLVGLDGGGHDLAVPAEHFVELLVGHLLDNVLDVQVRVLGALLFELGEALFLGDVVPHKSVETQSRILSASLHSRRT